MNNIIERTWKRNSMVNIEDLRGMAFQAESKAHTFRISGVDASGEKVTLSGTAGAVFLRADYTDVTITGTISNGVVSITLPQNCYDVPGRFGLTVYLTSDNQTVAIYAAIGSICQTSSGNVSPGSVADVVDLIDRINAAASDLSAINTATAAANAAAEAANQAAEDISDEIERIDGEVGSIEEQTGKLAETLVNEVENKTNLNLLSSETTKVISSNGDISNGTLSNQIVYAFKVTGYDAIDFKFTGRVGSETKIAFYSAATLANCSSSTLVGAVDSYTSAADNEVNVPTGAKTVVIGAKAMTSMKGVIKRMVSKADENLATSYNTQKIYYIGEYCVESGAVYRRKTYTGEAEPTFDETKWEQTKPTTEVKKINDQLSDTGYFDAGLFQIGAINSLGEIITNQRYRIVTTNIIHITETTVLEYASGYSVVIYYYDNNGDYLNTNTGGQTSLYYRTILKDSYIRIVINITGSTTTLENYEIRKLAHAVTFATEHKKAMDTIAENAAGAINALEAKMFQKGASQKTFSLAPCILVAGQSNIDGRVPKADLPSTIVPPFANIKNNINSTSGTFASSMTLPTSFGIDFSLYSVLNELGDPWYVIKKSLGGTSISPMGDSTYHWTPFYEELDDISKALLHTFDLQIKACQANNQNVFDFRALIWQQGEGDRANTSKQAALDYYKNFRCLIAYIRGITGNERLPVVCGTVSHLSGQYDPTVEEATLRVAEEDPYVICIDMSGAGLLDAYHFNKDAAVYFGYKAYDALIDLGVVNGTKINPEKPWND